jgi:hypothetical protein
MADRGGRAVIAKRDRGRDLADNRGEPMSLSSQTRAFKKARRQDEYQLTCAVAEYLDRALPETARFTHIPNGEKRDARTGAKLKRMGVRKGWPDFVVIYSPGYEKYGAGFPLPPQSVFIELKAGTSLSPSQREFYDWCHKIAQPYYICKSIEGVHDALRACGIGLRAR